MEQLHILRDLAVIFAGSLLVILVFYRLKLPALPGFIVAGILLGPNALGFVNDPQDVEGLASFRSHHPPPSFGLQVEEDSLLSGRGVESGHGGNAHGSA